MSDMTNDKQEGQTFRVGLFGHYGQDNLGDEAVILSSIQNLRERIPNIELVGLSLNPEDTRKRYDIEAFPIRINGINKGKSRKRKHFINLSWIRWFKDLVPLTIKLNLSGLIHSLQNPASVIRFHREVKEQLRDLDALIVCGSGQLEDYGGPWGYPYTIMKWVLLAKSMGVKVFVTSVGAGPPVHNLSFWMYKKALRKADYISYRDDWSKQVIEDRIPGIDGFIYPDLAHSLKVLPVNGHPQKDQKTVAINAVPIDLKSHMNEGLQENFDIYTKQLVELVRHVLHLGFSVKFFNGHPTDLSVAEEVISRLEKSRDAIPGEVTIIKNDSVQDLINTLSQADLIVATRFHSILLPLLLGKPVLGLCYHEKSQKLLEEVGLGEYCIDLNELSGQDMSVKFDLLRANLEEAKKKLASNYKSYAAPLSEQWDRVADEIKN